MRDIVSDLTVFAKSIHNNSTFPLKFIYYPQFYREKSILWKNRPLNAPKIDLEKKVQIGGCGKVDKFDIIFIRKDEE